MNHLPMVRAPGQSPPFHSASQSVFTSLALAGSYCVILIGTLALCGWLLDIPILRGMGRSLPAMNPTTAVLLTLCGIGLRRRVTAPKQNGRWRPDRLALVCAILVTLGGGLKLSEYLFHFSLLPYSSLFPHYSGAESYVEIAPNTAFCFLCCGAGLLFLDAQPRGPAPPAQPFLLVAGLIALLALVGYAYRVLPLYSVGSTMPMTLNTAIAFEVFALAGLVARPDRGFMATITNDTTGGAIARRLLPAAVFIPLVLGALCFLGERRGYLEVEFSISVFAVANVVLFVCVIWWAAHLLSLAEFDRREVERRIAVQYGATRALVESSTVPEAINRVLRAIGETLGREAGIMWTVDNAVNALRCTQTWHRKTGAAAGFVAASGTLTFKRGEGFPGRIWNEGRPHWTDEFDREEESPRALKAHEAGLQAAYGFPVQFDETLCGVIEFLGSRQEPPDETLLRMLSSVGSQVGQFIERKRAEEQLRHATAELQRSNTDLQQFAYVASHDLSEPLRMVVSYLQLLGDHARDKLDSDEREFMGYAIDGARRMQALINDLLEYARVDIRGRAFEPTDCNAVLRSVIRNLKVILTESNTEIEAESLPTLKADSIQLGQVFQNLIGNAVKFRRQDPPRIHVGARRQNNEWVFHVRDNGIGIDPRNIDRLFVLFQRLHTRQEYPGTGMGLAICKKIVERHGGRIWVESRPGEGSEFYFTLPAEPAG